MIENKARPISARRLLRSDIKINNLDSQSNTQPQIWSSCSALERAVKSEFSLGCIFTRSRLMSLCMMVIMAFRFTHQREGEAQFVVPEKPRN